MTASQRIRLARRHANLSQAQLGAAVGVQRSAVRQIALTTHVQFEWLATGRGTMVLSKDMEFDSVATAEALLVDDPLELRLLHAFREAPARARAPLVEVVEQLALQRTGRTRKPVIR
jgi:transcriptional regulator with XRE-family HTH domain